LPDAPQDLFAVESLKRLSEKAYYEFEAEAALGLPIQLVTGYKGTADIRLAAEGGELAGGSWSWDSINATWNKALESGDVVVVVQMTAQPHPHLPKVPLAINFVRTEDERQLIQ